ncbi:phosphotransferase family protein [Streptomyces sp. MNP-20]|uniref:phosphotransferase family protein n=1 Tax=Streptomyces sp. MNP-20 TaxID=2721165 RepID=UPI001555D52F|nr:phosphotransferase [Streptomyces sp. MNP-20]
MPNTITPRLQYSATAMRPRWDDLPQAIRRLIARRLGGAVDAGPSAGSGFTNGFAAVLRGAGEPEFVKAVNANNDAVIADCYKREALINQALPIEVPAPRLRWTEETEDGWIVLGFDAIDGGRMPAAPWKPDELAATLDACTIKAQTLATPSAALQEAGLKPIGDASDFADWRDLTSGATSVDILPAWVPTDRMDALAELECQWRRAVAGDAVLHHDLRQDNVLIDANGAAWICDWNWPCLGASWFDLVLLLAAAHADEHDATTLFADHPTGHGVNGEQLDAALAALSGFFLVSGAQPPADWSPYIRQHQTWCGEVTLRWLADRRGWTF